MPDINFLSLKTKNRHLIGDVCLLVTEGVCVCVCTHTFYVYIYPLVGMCQLLASAVLCLQNLGI